MAADRCRRLFLVRHGETTGQSSIRYYGSTDLPLSEEGKQQMLELGTCLAATGVRFDLAITSALQRSREAAGLIAPNVCVRPLAEFNEIHFGDWEGLTEEEIRTLDPQAHAEWRRSPETFHYPRGESVALFRSRVCDAFEMLLPLLPESTLFVAHKGVIRTVLERLLPSRSERLGLTIGLGSVQVLSQSPEGWEPLVLDATPHQLVAALTARARLR